MFTVDLHTHTRFFHWNRGSATRFDPIGARFLEAFARWRGLDGVAVTNHDYYRSYEHGNAVVTIPGIEVSTTLGHVLVVGPDPPTETVPGRLTPAEVVDLAHERDCVAILAHPYRNSAVADSNAAVDAVEVNGKSATNGTRVERLADGLGLPLVGGSDAHFPFEVGRAYTSIDADALTAETVVDAIRDGRVAAQIDNRFVNRLIRGGYDRLHAYKGHA